MQVRNAYKSLYRDIQDYCKPSSGYLKLIPLEKCDIPVRTKSCRPCSPCVPAIPCCDECPPIEEEVPIEEIPILSYTLDFTERCEGQLIQFTDTSTNMPTEWEWTFEGGTPATSMAQNPLVGYTTAGVYDVTLVAANGAGSDTITTADQITINPQPVAEFTFVANGLTVTFTSTSTDSLTYSWDFGDGTNSTEENPTHTFTEGQPWTVSLTTTNACGTDTVMHSLEVSQPACIPGDITQTNSCLN